MSPTRWRVAVTLMRAEVRSASSRPAPAQARPLPTRLPRFRWPARLARNWSSPPPRWRCRSSWCCVTCRTCSRPAHSISASRWRRGGGATSALYASMRCCAVRAVPRAARFRWSSRLRRQSIVRHVPSTPSCRARSTRGAGLAIATPGRARSPMHAGFLPPPTITSAAQGVVRGSRAVRSFGRAMGSMVSIAWSPTTIWCLPTSRSAAARYCPTRRMRSTSSTRRTTCPTRPVRT